MIQIRFHLTWPLALLILIAVTAWLLRHASQAQPAVQPIHYARVVNIPHADGPDSFDTSALDQEVEEAVRNTRSTSSFAEFSREFRKRGEQRRARTPNG